MVSEQKKRGQTYTPSTVSGALSRWAIQSSSDAVLEPSVGEGQFVFDVHDRLTSLGATDDEARKSIYGTDIDSEAVDTLQKTAKKDRGDEYPHIDAGNIFEVEFPEVDALVGNPPYVIRHRFENAEEIIEQFSEYDFSDQADLYCYFLVRATQFLKPGGRMAIIVSNSWMKREYGEEFKEFLLNEFYIHALVGFQKRVFEDLANSVCIIAEKRPNTIQMPADNDIRFIQAESDRIFNGAKKSLDELADSAIHSARVTQDSLESDEYWDIWLRSPRVFESIKGSDKFVPLRKYASPSIGVQTLHKDFYIISNGDSGQIEAKFLRPIAYSPRDHQKPEIQPEDCVYQLFWCSDKREELTGTDVLEYIEKWEGRTIEKRYSDETYDGLHNKTRIKKANRDPWYDLTDEARRRLPSEILLPRRVYENYTAVWNPEGVVPNENFLGTTVERDGYVKPLLAYLNSSLGELNLRLAGQVYGGGVCDLNVGSSKEIQTLDLEQLSKKSLNQLTQAFESFRESGNRDVLDEVLYHILGYTDAEQKEISDALDLAIAESVNKG